MKNLPEKLKNCYIEETVLDIRYSSKLPADAIFGVIYSKIDHIFTEKHSSFPILQIPEQIRCADPNLRYQPYHQLKKENFVLNIGPRVLNFINLKPYEGWEKWSKFFYKVLKIIIESKVISIPERVGLRYINIFENNIFKNVKCEIKLIGNLLKNESSKLQTEIVDDEYTQILQIGNSLNVVKNSNVSNNSVIDIDCIYKVNDKNIFFNEYKSVIDKAHKKLKKLFFSLLEDDFLKELKPYYGD
jgi:uncharacterized protein (TIGR04255 family)